MHRMSVAILAQRNVAERRRGQHVAIIMDYTNIDEILWPAIPSKVTKSRRKSILTKKTGASSTLSSSSRSSTTCVHDPSRQGGACLRCKFHRCGRRWGQKLHLPKKAAQKLKRKTWLLGVARKDRFGVGCAACKLALQFGSTKDLGEDVKRYMEMYGRCQVTSVKSFQLCHLQRHQDSSAHLFALDAIAGRKAADIFTDMYAPAADEFREVWAAARGGGSMQTVHKVGRHEKIAKMRWCLAEACRRVWRGFLRSASTVAFHEDKRQTKLLVRFTASNEKLEQMSGIMGLVTVHGGAVELVEATLSVVDLFCTESEGLPVRSRDIKANSLNPRFDARLASHVKSVGEFFNADAEGAEVLAGRMLSKLSPLVKALSTDLPNIRICNWDAAHGFKRLTSRPWKTNDYIADTFGVFISNKDSIVRLIQNSNEFRTWFQLEKTKLERRVGAAASNFSYKGHRMDSTSKPLSRAVLNCFATVATAYKISQVRRGNPEAIAARHFLEWVDDERLVMLAMLADSGDDSIQLTRFVDKENVAMEDVYWQVSMFVQKITMLYVDEEVLEAATYTRYLLQLLRHPMLVFIEGRPKTIGRKAGVAPNVLRRCLARMAAWVKMATAVADAEFPSFRIVVSFGIFSLTTGNERGQGAVRDGD